MLTSMTTEVGLPLEFASENNETSLTVANMTDPNSDENDDYVYEEEPNTALLSFILMFGTFMIAYGLKIFRNGKYMGRTVGKLIISYTFIYCLFYIWHSKCPV